MSGSGVTTDLNTLDAAFNEYAARRRLGEEPRQAFNKLGFYFGDDSLVDPKVFEEVAAVAKENGMVLTREAVPQEAGPGYAVFLSRVYPDIRTSLASHPCMVRNLRKLCTVMAGIDAPDKAVKVKLRLKAEAALITDSHVPVLSAYARALKRVYGLDVVAPEKVWESAMAQDADYRRKKETGPYPFKPCDEQLLTQSVAWDLGISEAETQRLVSRLNAAVTEADLAAVASDGSSGDLPEWARWVPTLHRDL